MTPIVTRMGKRLKMLRRQKKLTQQALADKAGLTREFIARLEAGQHDPGLSTLVKLAEALRVTLVELVK